MAASKGPQGPAEELHSRHLELGGLGVGDLVVPEVDGARLARGHRDADGVDGDIAFEAAPLEVAAVVSLEEVAVARRKGHAERGLSRVDLLRRGRRGPPRRSGVPSLTFEACASERLDGAHTSSHWTLSGRSPVEKNS